MVRLVVITRQESASIKLFSRTYLPCEPHAGSIGRGRPDEAEVSLFEKVSGFLATIFRKQTSEGPNAAAVSASTTQEEEVPFIGGSWELTFTFNGMTEVSPEIRADVNVIASPCQGPFPYKYRR